MGEGVIPSNMQNYDPSLRLKFLPPSAQCFSGDAVMMPFKCSYSCRSGIMYDSIEILLITLMPMGLFAEVMTTCHDQLKTPHRSQTRCIRCNRGAEKRQKELKPGSLGKSSAIAHALPGKPPRHPDCFVLICYFSPWLLKHLLPMTEKTLISIGKNKCSRPWHD